MSKPPFINVNIICQESLDKFIGIINQVGVVGSQGTSIITVYLADGCQLVFHPALLSILAYSKNGGCMIYHRIRVDTSMVSSVSNALYLLEYKEIAHFPALLEKEFGN